MNIAKTQIKEIIDNDREFAIYVKQSIEAYSSLDKLNSDCSEYLRYLEEKENLLLK